eukprot:Lithocolla_globosa_v1_NODE_8583_length_804_cov_88.275033.p2 type:complete len:128 gc:universal NODE_8583_length_804_cov_88.275033:794-411(-)
MEEIFQLVIFLLQMLHFVGKHSQFVFPFLLLFSPFLNSNKICSLKILDVFDTLMENTTLVFLTVRNNLGKFVNSSVDVISSTTLHLLVILTTLHQPAFFFFFCQLFWSFHVFRVVGIMVMIVHMVMH